MVDKKPKVLTEDQKTTLSTLAKHVINQLELRLKNIELEDEVNRLTKKAIDAITQDWIAIN